jgi:hypothetical protein
MIKNLVKVCASNVPRSPRAGAALALSPRTYVTEASEYVYNISCGNITGVDPACVGEDAVCSKILREIGHEGPALHPRAAEIESAEVHIVGRIWLAPLSVNNDKYTTAAF